MQGTCQPAVPLFSTCFGSATAGRVRGITQQPGPLRGITALFHNSWFWNPSCSEEGDLKGVTFHEELYPFFLCRSHSGHVGRVRNHSVGSQARVHQEGRPEVRVLPCPGNSL